MAQAGGFELQTLDTSMMYADGNQASISYATIDASIEGVNTLSAASKKQVVKDQTVTNLSAKFDVMDNLSVGLATYRAGAIQLDGGNGENSSLNITPKGDINLDSSALLARYNLNENLSFIGGITNNQLKGGNVSTLGGTYEVSGKSATGYVAGVAYSIPEIALRAELVYQPKTKISTKTSIAVTDLSACGYLAAINNPICSTPNDPLHDVTVAATRAGLASPAAATELALPDTLAFNFQSGIAENTLLTGSYRKASWGKAQINITHPVAPIATAFSDSEAYSVGLARRFTDKLSASITYSKEEGSSAPATSLFTVSNGSEAISLGVRYTNENMTISGGISQRSVGDVTVDPGFSATNPYFGSKMKYTGNTVTSMGVKISFAF